jgi:transcriptional regulator with XRE-family HTH domain
MATRIGSRLRRARLEQGVSQAVLAEKLGVSQATISNWEKGKGGPDPNENTKLVRILGPYNAAHRAARDAPGKNPTEPEGVTESRVFGDWLRRAREIAKMSVHELSVSSGISQVQIYNLEAGRSSNPRAETRERFEKALKVKVPDDVQAEISEEQEIKGLGPLTDFDPHRKEDRPACAGVYVFYDVSDRPVYVGKAKTIKTRVSDHEDKFWFKFPIVSHGAYVEIVDENLRHQVEQVLIKFLKSNAVINKQSVDRD